MVITRRRVLGGCLGVLGLASIGHLVGDPEPVELDMERDPDRGGPENWLEENRDREESALESYREGARLIEDGDYALARPKMEDAKSGFRSLFLDASEKDGEVFDKIAQYFNLMKAAAGSAKQSCVHQLQGDTQEANQYMETAINQHNEAQQVREEIRDSL